MVVTKMRTITEVKEFDFEIIHLKGDWQNHGGFKSDPLFGIAHSMGRIIDGKLAPYGIHPFASFHYAIDLDGKVYGCVPEHLKAWHAGKSFWKGLRNLNHHSIGAEFLVEGATTLSKLRELVNDVYNPPFTEEQYEAGSSLFAYLASKYDWDMNDILSHSQVSTKEVRPDPKFDAGEAFDMYRFKSMVLSKIKYKNL